MPFDHVADISRSPRRLIVTHLSLIFVQVRPGEAIRPPGPEVADHYVTRSVRRGVEPAGQSVGDCWEGFVETEKVFRKGRTRLEHSFAVQCTDLRAEDVTGKETVDVKYLRRLSHCLQEVSKCQAPSVLTAPSELYK